MDVCVGTRNMEVTEYYGWTVWNLTRNMEVTLIQS